MTKIDNLPQNLLSIFIHSCMIIDIIIDIDFIVDVILDIDTDVAVIAAAYPWKE